jgi:tRNA pseudouridine55 synthase
MATGVLPLFIGRATRAVEFMEAADKEYVAGLRLGVETDTQDITGAVLSSTEAVISAHELDCVLKSMCGEREQIPPMYSAVKVHGKKLYQYARAGIDVERKPRTVYIRELTLLEKHDEDFILRIVCSKGTYIRTLCSDIGRALGCGGTLSSLIRTRVGGYRLQGAYTLEQVSAAAKAGEIEKLILPVDTIFSEYAALRIDGDQEKKCRNGAEIIVNAAAPGRYRVYGEDHAFLLLGEVFPDGKMKTVKSFYEI